MTTYVRAPEAARILGVSPSTLYAYVSRGHVSRVRAADGRTSLFAVDELDTVRAAGRGNDQAPRPTIDVQIASAITKLGDDGVELRGHPLAMLVREHSFEDVAELLIAGQLPTEPTSWAPALPADRKAVTSTLRSVRVGPIARLTIAATVLGGMHPDDDTATAARRVLLACPTALSATATPLTGRYARRLVGAWTPRPSTELVDAIETALVLLADHELATSTLAVRVAASVRASPYAALVAGLSTVEGALHGSAMSAVHHFLEQCERDDPATSVARARAERRHIPGFGHKIYRHTDPRFAPLLAAARRVAPNDIRFDVIDAVLAEVARTIPTQPNVDFALGALSWVSDLPDDAPIFAVARLAGWAAHYDEELREPPVRFRGLARTP